MKKRRITRNTQPSSGSVPLGSCGLGGLWAAGAFDVRYLGQFGEHVLRGSFTARDPEPTSRASGPGLRTVSCG
jgi:hypothetical protein